MSVLRSSVYTRSMSTHTLPMAAGGHCTYIYIYSICALYVCDVVMSAKRNNGRDLAEGLTLSPFHLIHRRQSTLKPRRTTHKYVINA